MDAILDDLILFLEEANPVIKHTVFYLKKAVEASDNKEELSIDAESLSDICSHLALIYHMLIVSVASSISDENRDINKAMQKTLKVIRQLSFGSGYVSPEIDALAKAKVAVDTVFSKCKGRA